MKQKIKDFFIKLWEIINPALLTIITLGLNKLTAIIKEKWADKKYENKILKSSQNEFKKIKNKKDIK